MIDVTKKDLQEILAYVHSGLSIESSCEVGDECADLDRDVPIIMGYLLNVTEARHGEKYAQVAARFPTKKQSTLMGWKCAIGRLKFSYRKLPRGVRISQIKAVMTCDGEAQLRLLNRGVREDLGQEELMALVKAERGEDPEAEKECRDTVDGLLKELRDLIGRLLAIAPPRLAIAAKTAAGIIENAVPAAKDAEPAGAGGNQLALAV